MNLIAVGSKNIVKIEAVQEALLDYPIIENFTTASFDVSSEVSEQPLSIDEIITGAKNRARNAFSICENCKYSFGLESGLFKADGCITGYLESSICAIFDGSRYAIGLSCGFEIPPLLLDFILDQNMDLSQACYHSGITTNTKLGAAEGLIGILTKGRINRKEYTKQSIRTALIQLENTHLYELKSS